jgi:hypothetical protein
MQQRAAVGLVVVILPLTVQAATLGKPAEKVEVGTLEVVEEQTEAFANRVFDMSLEARAGGATELAPYFAASVQRVAIPATPGALAPKWKWVSERDWAVPAAEGPLSAQVAATRLSALLDRFSDVEDVRFKLKAAVPRGGGRDALDAAFKMWIVGRNLDGKREWVRGTGEIGGARGRDAWRVDRLVFDKLGSFVGERELFADVSVPAGVEQPDPSFMDRGASGLLAHGAAAADVDRDGLVDVFATGLTRNFLYLNDGDGTFRDEAASAHVLTLEKPGVAPLFLDFDADGDQDLFVTTLGRQVLLENRLVPDGKLVFRDVSTRARVDVEAFAFSATAGDVNGDGFTDVYVACYNDYGAVVPDRWDAATNGTRNLLFLSRGEGTFREAAVEAGVADPRWSYAATLADLDDDSDLDLVVGDDFGPGASLYLNDGKGRFRDATAERGLAKAGYSMGVAAGDVDNDGDLDLHVTNMSSNAGNRVVGRFTPSAVPDESRLRTLAAGNSLFRNLGGGRFEDVTAKAGPLAANWAWGGGFLDADNDGFEDLYTPNGFVSGALMHDT